MFALTSEDSSDGGAKGLVALLPAPDEAGAAEAGAAEAGSALLDSLQGVPSLPTSLTDGALFQAWRLHAVTYRHIPLHTVTYRQSQRVAEEGRVTAM